MLRALTLRTTVAATICAISLSAHAIADTPKPIDVPAGDLVKALETLARQVDISLVYQAKQIAGTHTDGAHGNLTPQEAVSKLLKGTKLQLRTDASTGAMLIEPARGASQRPLVTPEQEGNTGSSGPDDAVGRGNMVQGGGSIRMAQADRAGVANSSPTAAVTAVAERRNADSELAEVIVTARKRRESSLNVPVIETAIPQAQMEALQTTDVTDLVNLVTGVNVGHGIGSVGPQFSIRGVGTLQQNNGVDTSVLLNLDGMSIGTGVAFESGFFDLDQIEVLKGPQSLFFGKSTTAGVLALRSADPTDQFEVIARSSYEFESITPREELIVSGPVTDTLKLRLAGLYSSSEGYFYETGVAVPGTGALDPSVNRAPHSDEYMLRGTALWDPTDQFEARLKVNFMDNRSIYDVTYELTACPEGPGFAPFGIPFIAGSDCRLGRNLSYVGMDPTNFPGITNNGMPFNEDYQTYGTLDLEYHPIQPLQSLTLSSVTGFYLLRDNSLTNASGSSGAGPTIGLDDHFRRRELTQEIRLNSDFTSPVNFTVGALYEDSQFYDLSHALGNSAYMLPATLAFADITINVQAYSAFGQLRWTIVPGLELAAGLRWTDDQRHEIPINAATSPTTFVPTADPYLHQDNVAPEVTLTFRPTDDVTWFAAYKQAYKAGSYNLGSLPLPGSTNNSFGPEKAAGEEVGLKTRWLDRHLALDVAAYHYEYTQLQVATYTPSPFGEVLSTLNAGSARTIGMDLDAAYLVRNVDGLTLRGAATWNAAKYQTLDNAPCFGGQTIAMGCNQLYDATTGLYTGQNLSGTQMVRAPKWTSNLGFEYALPIRSNYKLTLTNNTSYSSSYPTLLAVGYPNNANYQSSYAKVDLGLSLQSPDDLWEVALIGKNINNKIIAPVAINGNNANGIIFGGQVTGGTVSGPAGVDQLTGFADPGREIWLRLVFKPFGTR